MAINTKQKSTSESEEKQMTITIRLFAIFRDYFENQEAIILRLPTHSTLQTVRKAFAENLSNVMKKTNRKGDPDNMVRSAAFALLSNATGEMEILTDDTVTFSEDSQLDLLPPVCGG